MIHSVFEDIPRMPETLTKVWALEPDRRKFTSLRLTLDVTLEFSADYSRRVRVLIDTGSEINLIRRGIIAPEFVHPVKHPLKIATASHDYMAGGTKLFHVTWG